MTDSHVELDLLERMVRAVERVRERLLRAVRALNNAEVPYAVVGGNAVAAWVAEVDAAATRNTQDVDLVIRRSDFERATRALVDAGFVARRLAGVEMFLDGPDAGPRDAIHVWFANERVRAEQLLPTPDVHDARDVGPVRMLSLAPLVTMKLVSFRTKDRMHLLDLISVGLIDRSWLAKVPAELAPRLRELLDNPEE